MSYQVEVLTKEKMLANNSRWIIPLIIWRWQYTFIKPIRRNWLLVAATRCRGFTHSPIRHWWPLKVPFIPTRAIISDSKLSKLCHYLLWLEVFIGLHWLFPFLGVVLCFIAVSGSHFTFQLQQELVTEWWKVNKQGSCMCFIGGSV